MNVESLAPRPVLYVEDQPVNALLMAALFERRPGLKLVVANSGQQALCIAAGLKPALLLLDLRLPDCHGRQLLPLLRLLPGCETAPAVAVTAEDGFELHGTGFLELWAKPLNLGFVLGRLDELTGPHGDAAGDRARDVASALAIPRDLPGAFGPQALQGAPRAPLRHSAAHSPEGTWAPSWR